jgi:hypothetical protein
MHLSIMFFILPINIIFNLLYNKNLKYLNSIANHESNVSLIYIIITFQYFYQAILSNHPELFLKINFYWIILKVKISSVSSLIVVKYKYNKITYLLIFFIFFLSVINKIFEVSIYWIFFISLFIIDWYI